MQEDGREDQDVDTGCDFGIAGDLFYNCHHSKFCLGTARIALDKTVCITGWFVYRPLGQGLFRGVQLLL